MKTENIIAVVVFALIGAVLVSAFIPAVASTQITAGIEENFDNDSTLFKMADNDETVTIVLSGGAVTLNGEVVQQTSNSNILLSDVVSFDQLLYQGNWLNRAWYKDSTALSYPTAYDLVFNGGTVTGTITRAGETITVNDTYGYLYYADANGKYCQKSGNETIDCYVNSTKDIVLSGLYYTGENDTTYSYINGVLTLENYTGSVEFTSEPVALDVLHVTGINVKIEDEEFTPFRYLVPVEVIGHTTTPTADIVGLLPLVAVMGIILTVIGAIFVRRV